MPDSTRGRVRRTWDMRAILSVTPRRVVGRCGNDPADNIDGPADHRAALNRGPGCPVGAHTAPLELGPTPLDPRRVDDRSAPNSPIAHGVRVGGGGGGERGRSIEHLSADSRQRRRSLLIEDPHRRHLLSALVTVCIRSCRLAGARVMALARGVFAGYVVTPSEGKRIYGESSVGFFPSKRSSMLAPPMSASTASPYMLSLRGPIPAMATSSSVRVGRRSASAVSVASVNTT